MFACLCPLPMWVSNQEPWAYCPSAFPLSHVDISPPVAIRERLRSCAFAGVPSQSYSANRRAMATMAVVVGSMCAPLRGTSLDAASWLVGVSRVAMDSTAHTLQPACCSPTTHGISIEIRPGPPLLHWWLSAIITVALKTGLPIKTYPFTTQCSSQIRYKHNFL